jgi:hypothetical protein
MPCPLIYLLIKYVFSMQGKAAIGTKIQVYPACRNVHVQKKDRPPNKGKAIKKASKKENKKRTKGRKRSTAKKSKKARKGYS